MLVLEKVMAENLDQKSLDEIRKNCGHLGARDQCDNCGAFVPTPQEMEDWKKKFITARQLLDLLPLCPWSEEHVYRLASARMIPSIQFGDEVLFYPRLAEWLRNLLESPTTPTL